MCVDDVGHAVFFFGFIIPLRSTRVTASLRKVIIQVHNNSPVAIAYTVYCEAPECLVSPDSMGRCSSLPFSLGRFWKKKFVAFLLRNLCVMWDWNLLSSWCLLLGGQHRNLLCSRVLGCSEPFNNRSRLMKHFSVSCPLVSLFYELYCKETLLSRTYCVWNVWCFKAVQIYRHSVTYKARWVVYFYGGVRHGVIVDILKCQCRVSLPKHRFIQVWLHFELSMNKILLI